MASEGRGVCVHRLLQPALMGLPPRQGLGGSEAHLLSADRSLPLSAMVYRVLQPCFLFSDKVALLSLEKHVILDYLGVPLLCVLKLMSATEQSVYTSS